MAGSDRVLAGVAATLLLAGCEARVGKEATDADWAAAPEGKAEEGSFSIDVPGFEMKLDLPESFANQAEMDSDSEIVYPGSKMSGIHIAADRDERQRGVELRFTSPDAPAKVAEWYRSGDRSDHFTIGAVRQEGGGYTLSAKDVDDGDPMTVSLRPAGGGTLGRIVLRDVN